MHTPVAAVPGVTHLVPSVAPLRTQQRNQSFIVRAANSVCTGHDAQGLRWPGLRLWARRPGRDLADPVRRAGPRPLADPVHRADPLGLVDPLPRRVPLGLVDPLCRPDRLDLVDLECPGGPAGPCGPSLPPGPAGPCGPDAGWPHPATVSATMRTETLNSWRIGRPFGIDASLVSASEDSQETMETVEDWKPRQVRRRLGLLNKYSLRCHL
jgi:hypothetical protein